MNKGVTKPLYGNYRAKVVENRDNEKYGRVLVWIPDLMPDIPDNQGIWARPANNPIGGRNSDEGTDENHYMGTSYIPRKGSWIWIFFEAGNINRPYYFGALDLQNAKVLPENQVGKNFEDKWTLFKSHEGRAVVISDDPDDARTEITGKKRKIKSPPSGDTDSVYTIDENQTTILFDERSGKEKILIRTYKGDFFHVDVDEQKLQMLFESDIIIKTNGKFQLTAEDDIEILSNSGSVFAKADSKINMESGADMNAKSGGNLNVEAAQEMNELAGANINIDGATLNEQSGLAKPAEATTISEADPKGERDT